MVITEITVSVVMYVKKGGGAEKIFPIASFYVEIRDKCRPYRPFNYIADKQNQKNVKC